MIAGDKPGWRGQQQPGFYTHNGGFKRALLDQMARNLGINGVAIVPVAAVPRQSFGIFNPIEVQQRVRQPRAGIIRLQ